MTEFYENLFTFIGRIITFAILFYLGYRGYKKYKKTGIDDSKSWGSKKEWIIVAIVLSIMFFILMLLFFK